MSQTDQRGSSVKRRTRVKICGIRDVRTAHVAVAAGADALGLVFYPSSPRAVDITLAAEIAQACPPFVTLVGLFVNAQKTDIDAVCTEVPLQLLQFHGDESADFCSSFTLPYIKALRIGDEKTDIERQIASYASAQGILLDTYRKGIPGGTGERFDWNRVPASEKPIVLAGGLTPENAGEAIRQVKPYSLDVSGGVESAPGVKDADKIRAFIDQVVHTDRDFYA